MIQTPEVLGTVKGKAFVANGAVIIGNVTLDEYSSVWFNCSLRGDEDRIKIGQYSNIQDNSVIHEDPGYPCVIGDYVTVGHNCILHGCIIEDHCLIGMGAIIMTGAVIGRGSIIAAGAVITEKTVIPPHSLVVGTPGKIKKEVAEKYDSIHAQALKYKTLWTEKYGLLPACGGERYDGEKII